MLNGMSDSEKLRYLFDTYGSVMYAVANRIVNDYHLAEDVVQEVLIRVFREDIMKKMESMDESAVKAYLLITTKHIAINFYVRRKREAGTATVTYNDELLNDIPTEDTADSVIRKVEEENLFKIISGMSERYSYVLLSKYKYGLSDKQIAAMCNITESTVRKRLERGRKMLLERLEERHCMEDTLKEYKKGGK